MQCLGRQYFEIKDDGDSQLESLLAPEITVLPHDIFFSFLGLLLIRLFSSMEYDGTGAISIDDYIRRCEIKVSTFATIAFSAFDSERTGGK